MPTVAAPGIERAFALSHASTALVLFVVPGIVAMLVEPIVFLYADRYPRRHFIRGGITAMALGAIGAAVAPGPITLAIAVAVSWIATGASVSLAQATLVDGAPDRRAATMARWTILAAAGDLAAPILLGALAFAGHGWRAAYLAMAGLLAAGAVVTWLVPLPGGIGAGDDDDDDERGDGTPAPGIIAALRDALRDRALIAWLLGVALCDLLDEILVVFATLHARDALGAGPAVQSALVGANVIGGLVGLVILERLLVHRRDRALLVGFSVACAIAFVAWVAAPVAWLSIALMVPVGACSAPLYPLAAAQAFARRPEQSGAVLAAGHLFTPLGLALPWLIGTVADHAGTYVALLVLVAQPLGLVALVAAERRRP